MDIPRYPHPVPSVTTEQMREVDRAMIEDFHIKLIQMMENAGRHLAHLARVRFFENRPEGQRVVVLAGTGGNGGGVLVAARRLWNFGALVQVITTKPAGAFTPVPTHQLDILERMGVTVLPAAELPVVQAADLILDGLIGYSLQGAPRGSAAALIRWANDQSSPILSLDAPSGVDTTTGKVFDPAVKATATMTLALPKEGLLGPDLEAQVGELYLADISVPPQLYSRAPLNIEVGTLFAQSELLRLR